MVLAVLQLQGASAFPLETVVGTLEESRGRITLYIATACLLEAVNEVVVVG